MMTIRITNNILFKYDMPYSAKLIVLYSHMFPVSAVYYSCIVYNDK